MEIASLMDSLLQGDKAALARCITYVESSKKEHRSIANEILEKIHPFSGKSIRIGITGVPGVGKSTFIEQLGMMLISQNHKVAVLAIDPSSSKSSGSILGDKTRMNNLAVHPKAYIRPTAAGKSLGGVAFATKESILLCEAAGYDIIIVETVGVGQSETAVYDMTDFFLLLMLSGAGDELQGIKRGIMEMADAVVITKADGENLEKAKAARNEYARALHFLPKNEYGWSPKVMINSALMNTGMDEVWSVIKEYLASLENGDLLKKKRIDQELKSYDQLLQNALWQQLLQSPTLIQIISDQKSSIKNGDLLSYTAVQELMEKISLQFR